MLNTRWFFGHRIPPEAGPTLLCQAEIKNKTQLIDFKWLFCFCLQPVTPIRASVAKNARPCKPSLLHFL